MQFIGVLLMSWIVPQFSRLSSSVAHSHPFRKMPFHTMTTVQSFSLNRFSKRAQNPHFCNGVWHLQVAGSRGFQSLCILKKKIWGRTVRRARAVRKVGCFPPPVATGPRVLNSAPPCWYTRDFFFLV